jgi:hypothetical protein
MVIDSPLWLLSFRFDHSSSGHDRLVGAPNSRLMFANRQCSQSTRIVALDFGLSKGRMGHGRYFKNLSIDT